MQKLTRHYGFWTGWFVVVASMVGSGILTNSGPMLKLVPSYPFLFLLWFVGGVLALMGALALSEMASAIPKVGGEYAFVRLAFGPAWGFVYGWAMVFLGFSAPIALISYSAANFLLAPFPIQPMFIRVVATAFILFFTVAHSWSYRTSSWMQNGSTFFKLFVFWVFIGLCFASPQGQPGHLVEALPLISWTAAGKALIFVIYAYTGWNAAAYLGGEMNEPERNVPKSIFWGCVFVTFFYLLMNLAYAWLLPLSEILSLTEDQTNRLATLAIEKTYSAQVAGFFSIAIGTGVFASISAYVLTGPRVVYAMAEDGFLPIKLTSLSKRSKTPALSICTVAVLAIMLLWSGTFEQVLHFTGYGLTALSLLLIAPIFVLRKKDYYRPSFRMPGYPVIPILFLVTLVFVLMAGFIEEPKTSLISLCCILFGFILFSAIKRLFK